MRQTQICRSASSCRLDFSLIQRPGLVEKGVLVPLTEPTRWVSQMAAVHKRDGKLRICIDPQPLNAAFKREHYRLPMLDDVLPQCPVKPLSVRLTKPLET